MRFIPTSAVVAALIIGSLLRASAQILIGTNGTGVLTFNTQPTTTSGWSTVASGFSSATFTSSSNLDAVVISNTLASAVNLPLGSTGTVPPAQNNVARWNNAAFYLQTRSANTDYLLLMATLRNDTGSNVTQIKVRFDWDQKNAIPVNEDIPGHRVFYSLSGDRGSWKLIPSLSTFTVTSLAQVLTADIPLGSWTNGGTLYLIWADDNGPGSTTNPQEGAYTIDNFSVTAVVPTVPVITAHPQSHSVAPGGSTMFSVSVLGAEPFTYQWFKDSNLIAGATGPTLAVQTAQSVDEGFYFVSVSNGFGIASSSNGFLTVTCAQAAAISLQSTGQFVLEGDTFGLSLGAVGTPPISYQWLKNGAPLANATNATLTISNAQHSDTAYYSVQLQNCSGTALSTSVIVSIASRPYALLELTNHVWNYNDLGSDLNPSWRETSYDDSAWLTGRGLLAREDNTLITPLTNTVLRLLDPTGAQFITHYFRTKFMLSNTPSDILLVSSNYIDDGAVVYVNGTEAFRFNLPTGMVASTTTALAANPLGEGIPFTTNLPSGLFLQGTNVIAVEVHQNSSGSTDAVFGMQLRVVPLAPTPLAFTNQPADTEAFEGGRAEFAGAVSGNNARFQWFKDAVPIPNATTPFLTLNSLTTADAGAYVLQASNLFGAVYSRIATLTVLRDQVPPHLISADLLDATHVLASFSKIMHAATATNVALYSVTNTLGDEASVLRVIVTNETNVLITTTPLAQDRNYILSELGVANNGPSHTPSPGSAVPVARRLTLISFDSTWEFLDPYPPFDDPAPGPGWKEDGYDTSTWGSGPGAFAYPQATFVESAPASTSLSPTPVHTSYFRTAFEFPGSPAGVSLWFRHAFDDAVVLYLNGQELHRTNLPPGVISPETPALVLLQTPYLSSNINASAAAIRPGQNLFAAELHQFRTNDADKFFGIELIARVESLATGPVLLLGGPDDLTVSENTSAIFRAQTVGALSFQWLMNGTNLPGATNALLTIEPAPLALDGSVFSVISQGPGGTVSSTGATLRVTPDLQRPHFVDAMGTNDTITITFSELIDAFTATNIANYSVTNSSGESLPVINAVLVNGSNVVLQFGSLAFGRYGVVVNNVRDASVAGNVIRANSAIIAGYSGRLLPIDASWRYDQSAALPGQNWPQPGFNDTTWLTGNALFFAERGGGMPVLPEPVLTTLLLSNAANSAQVITYYFRTTVQSASAGNATLSIRAILDDGLILYLNGAEILRRRMNTGTPAYTTLANATVGDPSYEGPFLASVTNVSVGGNLLAAEVHQGSTSSADVAFALEIHATMPSEQIVEPELPGPAVLRLVKWGNEFALTWDDSVSVLETSASVHGPWLPSGQPNPVFVSATNVTAFYRLRR